MSDICSDTGAYLRNSLQGHFFDETLCDSIFNFLKLNNCKTVYDFGCGHGEYTKNLIKKGIDCSGFDGNPFTKHITDGLCNVLKLNEPIFLDPVDCVICLEVGEHIPKEFENILFKNIVNSTKNLIILSWAIEGQIGEGHVNCRNNDYIKEKMMNFGFENLSDEENLLRCSSTLSWFKNTIMIYKKVM